MIDQLLKERLVAEYYKENFRRYTKMFEEIFNIDIVKEIGEGSSGVAYLTSDNKVLKITSIETEIEISEALINNPSPYFPTIYQIEGLGMGDGWHGILKSYTEKLPPKIKSNIDGLEDDFKEFAELEGMGRWALHHDVVVEAQNVDWFMEYLEEDEPDRIPLFNAMIQMVSHIAKYYDDEAIIDIHSGNVGYNGKHLVLFDY